MAAQTVKRVPATWETRVQSLGQEDPLEKEMATHSSTLAWKTPWTEEPGRLQSMGLQSRTRLSNFTFHFFFSHPLTFSSFQTWEGEQGPRFTDEQVESQSSLVISEPVPGCPCFLQQDAS